MVSAVYSLIRLAGLMEAPQCTSSMWHLLSGLFERDNEWIVVSGCARMQSVHTCICID